MKKNNLILLLLLCAPTLFFAQSTEASFFENDMESVRRKAAAAGKLYFLYFSADWCMPCQWMEENTFSDQRLQAFVSLEAMAAKVDIDAPLGRARQKLHQVTTLPTILIFGAQGRLLHRCEETLSAEELLTLLQSFNQPENCRISVASPKVEEASPLEGVQMVTPTTLPPGRGDLRLPTREPESPPVIARPVVNVHQEFGSLPAMSTETYPPAPLPDMEDDRPAIPAYGIQLGAFRERLNALRLMNRLERKVDGKIEIRRASQNGQVLYKVITGRFSSRAEALEQLQKLKVIAVKGFVVRMASAGTEQ